jgi:hypothetical protein
VDDLPDLYRRVVEHNPRLAVTDSAMENPAVLTCKVQFPDDPVRRWNSWSWEFKGGCLLVDEPTAAALIADHWTEMLPGYTELRRHEDDKTWSVRWIVPDDAYACGVYISRHTEWHPTRLAALAAFWLA